MMDEKELKQLAIDKETFEKVLTSVYYQNIKYLNEIL